MGEICLARCPALPAAPHSCLRQEDVGETRGQVVRDAGACDSQDTILIFDLR